MKTTKCKIMSFSATPEIEGLIKSSAHKLGMSVSVLIRKLAENYIPLMEGSKSNSLEQFDEATKNALNVLMEKSGSPVDAVVKNLVQKYAPLTAANNEIPIIIKVPNDLKGNTAELKTFLEQKVDAIVKHLG